MSLGNDRIEMMNKMTHYSTYFMIIEPIMLLLIGTYFLITEIINLVLGLYLMIMFFLSIIICIIYLIF
jgi:hypothetical protein